MLHTSYNSMGTLNTNNLRWHCMEIIDMEMFACVKTDLEISAMTQTTSIDIEWQVAEKVMFLAGSDSAKYI